MKITIPRLKAIFALSTLTTVALTSQVHANDNVVKILPSSNSRIAIQEALDDEEKKEIKLVSGETYIIDQALVIKNSNTTLTSTNIENPAILKFEPEHPTIPTCSDDETLKNAQCGRNSKYVERLNVTAKFKTIEAGGLIANSVVIYAPHETENAEKINNISIMGLKIIPGDALKEEIGHYVNAISIRAGDNHIISHNEITGFERGYMIELSSSSNSKITDNHIHDISCCSDAKNDYIQITGISIDDFRNIVEKSSDNLFITNNRIDNFKNNMMQTDGINISNFGNNNKIVNNYFNKIDESIDIFSRNGLVAYNYMQEGFSAIKIVHGANNNTIRDNIIKSENTNNCEATRDFSISGGNNPNHHTFGNVIYKNRIISKRSYSFFIEENKNSEYEAQSLPKYNFIIDNIVDYKEYKNDKKSNIRTEGGNTKNFMTTNRFLKNKTNSVENPIPSHQNDGYSVIDTDIEKIIKCDINQDNSNDLISLKPDGTNIIYL